MWLGVKLFCRKTFHDGGIVGVRNYRALGLQAVGITYHAKQAQILCLTVNRPLRIKNFVPAMFTIGLRKHEQLDIARVALNLAKGLKQIVNFIV